MMAVARASDRRVAASGNAAVRRRISDAVTLDTREVVAGAKTRARSEMTIGFGCPPLSTWPHHVVVSIPTGRGGDIRVHENHGLLGHADQAEDVERCVVPRARWNQMSGAAKAELNARLREKKLPTGRWEPGDNRVDRILGTELMTLAWAVTAADDVDVPAVVASWVSLQPSERLWLAGRVLANPAAAHVRRGIALLLASGPVAAEPTGTRTAKSSVPQTAKASDTLPLFDLR